MPGKRPKIEEVEAVEPRTRYTHSNGEEGEATAYGNEHYPLSYGLAQVAMGTLRVAAGADPKAARDAREEGFFDTAMYRMIEERTPPEVKKWLREFCGPKGLATIAIETQLTRALHHQLEHFMMTDEALCWPYCGGIHNP